jgi:alpha-glucosidase (family GH31 glycosyl hydrolase)
VLVFVAIAAACGDNSSGLEPPPDSLEQGPVSIDLASMSLAVGPLAIERFLHIGQTDEVDEFHYYDPRGGDFQVELVPITRALGDDGESIVLEGGTKLRLGPCPIADCALLELDASAHAGAVQLQLAMQRPGEEPLYGTGDAPVRANVAGTVREMSLRVDPASESSLNEVHTPVPLVLWPRSGVGMLAADDRPGALDLAKTDAGRVTATFTLPERGTYRFYLYTAPEPLELVRRYVALTTKPALPPRWAFAPQQWRNVWNSSDEVRLDMTDMRSRKIPGSLMWIDNPWQTAYNNFVIDEQRLVDPDALIAELNANGYHVLFWSTPYVGIDPISRPDHDEGAANQFFVTDDAGRVIDYPWQDGPGAMVDFTRPGATEWWQERIARVVARGARGFKLDFGEEVVPDIGGSILPMILAAGDNGTMHRRYQEHYHRAYLDALPAGDGFLITRAGAWGEQHVNTTIWPGDLDSDFSEYGVDNGEGMTNVGGLPSAISRGLGLSVSGYPFYGSDIGGFRGFPTTEALLRWAEYAAFGTIMQLGGGGKSHNPWDTTLFDAGADVIYKTYADIHMQLNPLLWTLANIAHADGTPITIPARFVADCACDDAMFFLGPMLIAPVIVEGATTRDVVLPTGDWMDLNTGALVRGDGVTSITVPAPLGVIPRWQLLGTFVPMFARAADTMLPATAPGVTSYTDPAFGSELRLVYAPIATQPSSATPVVLHDGAAVEHVAGTTLRLTAGTEYTVFTIDIDARSIGAPYSAPAGVDVDGVPLAGVADVTSCAAPGCFSFDAGTKRLQARVFVGAGSKELAFR